MKAVIILVCLLASIANSFHINNAINKAAISKRIQLITRMSDNDQPKVDLVPVDKVNIENAAAVTGGILGFVLGGPVIAAIFAAVTNYVSKKDGESGEALRGVGKTVVESYNFLTKLNSKYSITNKVTDSVGKAISSVETDSEVIDTVKKTYVSAASKIEELNKEYDLVSKGKEVIVATATLSDAAIDKVIELNAKYDFVDLTKKAATTVVDKIKETTAETK